MFLSINLVYLSKNRDHGFIVILRTDIAVLNSLIIDLKGHGAIVFSIKEKVNARGESGH
jgi:hypothetical protein